MRLLLIFVILIFSCQSKKEELKERVATDKNITKFWGNPPTNVDNPSWKIVEIDTCGLKLKYQEKYGSLIDTSCIGLWESTNQYMLTWKDNKKLILEKSNLVSIQISD